MVEGSQGFPHIQLRLTTEGRAASPPGGGKKNLITVVNLGNRQGHGGKLKGSVESLIFDWQDTQEEREQEKKPLLKSRRIILEIDPDSFNPDGLKAYGIELIADTEDGYIIGASADLELSELQEKIEKFINEKYGGNKVAEIWEVIDGKKKPELILSPNLFAELYEKWLAIKEEQIYTVDVGVACVGTKTNLPNYPQLQPNETTDNFTTRVKKWIQKRQLTEQEWEEISWERQDEFEEFIQFYKVNSFELTEAFSIAVVGHEGWNNDPEATVPYSLVVSFEAIQVDIPIYTPFVEAQVEIEIQPPIEIQSIVVS
ncbi:hypothetical protein [Nostoc sp.]|uniref:hypothetical protein n=1 Tax=Nostoc sp. TaxID=1180 RepID=UPI002FF8E843